MKKITLLIFVMFAFSFYSCEQDFVVEDADAIATKKKKKKENSDCECDKEVGITALTLEYKGDAPVGTPIVVKTEKPKHYGHDHNKKKNKKFDKALEVWTGEVGAIETLINMDLPTPEDEDLKRLGNKTWIQIGDNKPFEIHTSCSQPIIPGTVFGDFVVISGASGDQTFDCQADIPSGDCGECDGQITYLEIEYLGTGPATIDVYGHKKQDKAPFFTATQVSQGDSFSFSGKENHNKMGPKIFLEDGSGDRVEIHTSCSQPIEVGMVFGGKYLIKAGASHEGGPLCEEEDCISRLQDIIPTGLISGHLTDYDGDPQSYFQIDLTNSGALTGFYEAHCLEKDPPAIRNTIFDAWIYSTYEPLPSEVTTRTSLGAGILENLDKINYVINHYKVGDPVDWYDASDEDPLKCEKLEGANAGQGLLTYTDFQQVIWYFTDYSFDSPQNNDRIKEHDFRRIFSVICDANNNGEGFEPECGDKIGAMIVPVSKGQISMIILDCIDDCDPPEEENCGPCEGGGISSLTLEYKGTADKITVTVKGKKGKKGKKGGDSEEAFSEEFDVSSNKTFTVKSDNLAEKIGGSNELILTDSNGVVQNIHISCSQPIDIGLVFGDYEIIDGYGVKSGPFCKD